MSFINFKPSSVDIFDQFFTHSLSRNRESSSAAVNVKENDKSFNMEVIAPGIDKKDISISIDHDILSIGYEKKESDEENSDDGKYHRREFNFDSFKRTFTLPKNVDRESIGANYENGVLKLTIPKKEYDVTSKTIDIG